MNHEIRVLLSLFFLFCFKGIRFVYFMNCVFSMERTDGWRFMTQKIVTKPVVGKINLNLS